MNSNYQGSGSGVSRRRLLQATAAAGALGILDVIPAWAQEVPATGSREVLTASHWGAFYARVENGRIVSLRPWEKDPSPSQQLAGVQDVVTSPTRIKYPMVRRAFVELGPGAPPETRGQGDFVRVGWAKALDLVAHELFRVRETYGPSAVFGGSYGWKSPGKLHNCQAQLRRLLNLTGGFVNVTGDHATGAAQSILPHVLGGIEVYEQQTAWPVILENTELLVYWGADPANNNQIGYGIPDHGTFEWLPALKRSKKPVICINPLRTESGRELGAEWIAPRPQTDLALMLGIAHTLFTENLHHRRFLTTHTVGFDRFLPYLLGTADGTPKSAEWASGICGIGADAIRDLARRFARHRTMLAGGWSLQRQHHGEQHVWMLVTLACMLGQIGLPGGGFGLSYHYGGGGSPSADSPTLRGLGDWGEARANRPWDPQHGAPSIPVARLTDMLLNPGQPFDFNGQRQIYPDIKLAYWVGGNPFVHQPQINRLVEAFRNVQTFIVHDYQWTPTARHADIVLPATTVLERNDIEQVGDYTNRAIIAMKKVVDPMYESRNDWDIFADLAGRFGQQARFTQGKSELDWIRSFYEGALVQAKRKKIAMPDFEAFWQGAGVVEFPVALASRKYVRYADFRANPVRRRLSTPSGLIEIYSQTIEKMGYPDCPPHPTWLEPVERLGGPGTKYPLHVNSAHPAFRLQSQLCGTVLRGRYAVAGREPCLINPVDAEARGIRDGDVVRVFNDRGQMLAGAKITDDTMPGVVCVNAGGWYDPVQPGTKNSLDRYGSVNVLSIDIGTSRLGQANTGHTAMAEVEKFNGPVPSTTVFEEPGTRG